MSAESVDTIVTASKFLNSLLKVILTLDLLLLLQVAAVEKMVIRAEATAEEVEPTTDRVSS